MGNPFNNSVSQRQQAKAIKERIEQLENGLTGIVTGATKSFGAVDQKLNSQEGQIASLARLVEALVEITGVEVVDAKMTELRDIRIAAEAKAAKDKLESLVASGRLAKSETIGEASFLVGKETDAEGNELPHGFQLPIANVVEAIREQLIGKPAGTKVQTPNGGTFEVVDVYEVLPPPAEETTAEVQP